MGATLPNYAKVAALPNLQQCTHKTGRLWFTVSNYGIFGNQGNYFLRDCLTGQPASSAEFPGGSNVEYLLQGSLWIGVLVGPDKDSLVHLGTDGWRNIRHFFPGSDHSGEIIRRSANRQSLYYDLQAKSDMDLIATFYDTVTNSFFNTGNPDPEDGRTYKPFGLKIVQRSYSWASGWGQDWVLLDYQIHNQGRELLRKVYAGIFLDPDIGYLNTPGRGEDDLSGLIFTVPSQSGNEHCKDTIGLAYAYDNDGDPEGAIFGVTGPEAAIGVRVVRLPEKPTKVIPSFNWWTIDDGGNLDWGPQKRPGRVNAAGGRGQPMGNAMKYFFLSNQERDFDQVASAINQSVQNIGFDTGWVAPLTPLINAVDVANGSDTRFLLSFGPFDLDVGDSLPLTFGLLLADGFHQEPDNFERNLGANLTAYADPAKVHDYIAALNTAMLIQNSRLANQVFDNPFKYGGRLCTLIVSEVDGGLIIPIWDSVRVGDGIPDFRGPSAPPLPSLNYTVREGEVIVRWFGKETERGVDPFTGIRDFEGYQVHYSTDGRNFTTVGSYDQINWKPYIARLALGSNFYEWVPSPTPPLTYQQIQELYAVHWDQCRNKSGLITHPIDPQKYNAPSGIVYTSFPRQDPGRCAPDTTKTAIRVRFYEAGGSYVPDTVMYFVPWGYNLGLDQVKLYPTITDPDNDSAYWYQYRLSGLLPSEPVYLAIIAFDNGFLSPTLRIEPQSYIPSINARKIYPIAGDSERVAKQLKVSVYPNPYRIDHNYSHFEKPQINQGVLVSTQKLNFVNLPPKCTIRIYTLDGDLVQQINHDKDPRATDAGYETWDLLTRNAQRVVSGLYLFTVESNEGRYIGKIIIIQ